MVETMESRKNLYRFLSQLYLMEIDAALLKQMKEIEFPEDVENESLAEGFALLAKSLRALSEERLDHLAADYAKTFLAAGSAQGNAAFPYGSVYTGRRRLTGQAARAAAAGAYAEHGLEPGKPVFKIPEDHISMELEFMAILCERWAEAADDAAKAELLDAQKQFFRNHMMDWVFLFCADADRYAETDFYKGLAKVTRGFLQQEKDWFMGV